MEENKELRKETESITEELIKDKSTNKKKKPPKALIVLGCMFLGFVLLIVLIIYDYKKDYPGARTDFASIEEFGENWGYVPEELPEGASDVRYYINRNPLEYKSIYSFVLADEEDFDASYTDEELKEMAYVEEHFEEMDSYFEIPMKECFDYVIDEDLGDYIILHYDPSSPAIAERTGCFVNMETRRVVVFRYSCW